ncbi:MAG: DUF5011 domain-containing protein, partial [Clostridium sp.]|uniref:immunoglobulin-like domain-containing protein n=1 Tax=Clostridium sp. TaxID=1506 RepID=UPI002A75FFF0
MLNKKKALISLLCVIIFLFNTTVNTFAINITNDENVKSNDVVYLTEGQGSEWAGNGSKSNPYRNIKTALKNVNPGGTIKITGKFNYWKYEETSDLLYRPLIIDKEVTIEGAETNNEFIVRAPIQLGADVTFKNINLQFWASNELMPGVPDSGMPQTPIDEGTTFRSGRTIYLAGYKLTLQSVDTRIPTESFQRDYRPFISGGTFRNEGTTGNKAVLDVIDANVYSAHSTVLGKTEFAGIYAGDYWVERDYPVELNVKGRVLDRTIHTGGIMVPSKSEVTINLSNNTGIRTINTEKHDASADLNIIDGAGMIYANLNGIRNLNIGSGSRIEISENSKFEVENITLKSNSLLDFTNLTGNPIVKGDFTGENSLSDVLAGGAIFLNDNQTLDISGDVKGTIKLNYFNDINRVPLKENHLYIKAKENATGDFIINPQYNQSNFRLERNDNDLQRTTWTAVKDKDIFKDFIWIGNSNDIIPIPENTDDYLYHVKYINEKDESYIPIGDDWNEFIVTLEKPDGTILDTVNNDWDFDLSIGMYDDVVCVYFVNTSFTGELILTLNHISGKSISKKIQVGNINNAGDPVINGADNTTIKFGDVDEFNKDLLDGITVTDDKDTIDPKSIKVDGQVGKPLPGTDGIYKITYEVTDNDNNTTTVYRMVTVTNRLPEIVANNIEIKAGNSINLLTDGRIGLNATDHEDGNKKTDITLKSTGELNQSNPSEGTYRVTYEVEDNDGNIVEKDIIVTVISNKKPTINGADNITIKFGQVDNFDLLDGIIVTDDHDKNLVATPSGTINKPSAGTNLDSQITYTVEDSDGNVTTVTRVITVTNQLPTIEGLSDITIKQGETFDLRAGVTANDNEDGIISDRIVFPNVNLSTLNVGKHEITYKVTDSDNNTVTKTRVVNVEVKQEIKPDTTGVLYQTHVQDYGWQEWKSNGEMSGTSGESKRLEGIRIKINDIVPGASIKYRTHVQDYGWQEWKSNGEMSGT